MANQTTDEDFHLPNVTNIDGALDFFMLANIIELINVLAGSEGDQYMAQLEREAVIHARKSMRVALIAFFAKYTIEDDGTPILDPQYNVYLRFFVRQVQTLDAMLKQKAKIHNVDLLSHSPDAFKLDIMVALGNYEEFWPIWEEEGGWNPSTSQHRPAFLWPDSKHWAVVEKEDGGFTGMSVCSL